MRSIFRIQDNDEGRLCSGKRSIKLMMVGLLLIFFVGMVPVVAPVSMIGHGAIPTSMLIAFLTSVLIAIVLRRENQEQTSAEKRKRGTENVDMYSFIDRMVDDLNEDELDYLRHRIDTHLAFHERETERTLEELLDQREDARQLRG